MNIGPRSSIYATEATRPGNGDSRMWSRDIGSTRYNFTAVLMPSGERRYFVSRYNGYGEYGTPESRAIGMTFGCAWSPVHEWIIPAPMAPVRPVWSRFGGYAEITEVLPGGTVMARVADSKGRIAPDVMPTMLQREHWMTAPNCQWCDQPATHVEYQGQAGDLVCKTHRDMASDRQPVPRGSVPGVRRHAAPQRADAVLGGGGGAGAGGDQGPGVRE